MIHTQPDGVQIEYRRLYGRPGILDLEHRILKPDGTPYSDRWFTVSDRHLSELPLEVLDHV